jgi:3-oxoacyl-[acyl-carrier protein] reductase
VSARLEGKVALVTGGAGFIGGAITQRFCQEGATVVVADLDISRADAFVAGLDLPDPGRVSLVEMDALEDSSVRAAVDRVVTERGAIDVLVPLVGGSSDALIQTMTDAQWDRVMDLNLRSAFLVTRAALPGMMERGSGKVVLMSSRSHAGNIGQANYAAAKAGIIGLTSSLAREMARYGINVNCVVPGFIDNPRLASMPEKYRQMRIDLNPFKAVGSPIDVANVILFLASDEARQVTGQAIHVASW